jgi:sphingolipid delta-4 desaturase
MKLPPKEFQYSKTPEPHKDRTRAILKSHPEVREQIGRNPYSFLIILFVVGLQILIAYLLSNQSWWAALIVAFAVGAFANHACFVLIHEAAHNLIFKNRTLNYISGILVDIPNVLPSSVSFRSYHLKHHSFQGDYYLDADLASKWEAKLIGNSFFGKALWEIFFPVFQAVRTPRLKEIQFINTWTIVNWVVVFGVDALVIIFFGWTSFLYLVFSFFFSIGFHPLGARWIQEHFLVSPPQETYSYYGPLNLVALNVGYHNEHHDFPSVPWNNLPKLKAAAPEFYDNLVYHKSWTMLWLKFLFDSNLSLYSRMLRNNRDGITVE